MIIAPTASDYLWQFQRLLPRGRIWHRGWGTVQAEQLLTLMPTWVRLNARANALLPDAFPCSTIELLPEWEASLGLPDPCTGPFPTIQQRQNAVCVKFTARGGQTIAYYEELAERFGFTIHIRQFTPFKCGINRCGDPLYGAAWAHAWRIEVQGFQAIVYFRTGMSAAGEPLRAWGNEVIECLIRASAPAHTVPIFAYVSHYSPWDDGYTIWDGGRSVWDQTMATWDYGRTLWDEGKSVWDDRGV